MTRRDAITHGRALLRHLTETGVAPGWRAALRTLIGAAETVERSHRRRVASTAPEVRRARAASAAAARWGRSAPAGGAAETGRRQKEGRPRQATPPDK